MQICNSCHGGCCRNSGIVLTGYDTLNISRTLNIEPISFIRIIPVEGEEDLQYKSRHAALFKFADSNDDNFYLLGMRKVESQLVPGTAKCHFLMEWYPNNHLQDEIVARCGIYNSRPLICSTFTSQLDETEKCGIVYNLDSVSENSENPIYNLCPGKVMHEDIANSADQIMKALIMQKYELDYFKTLASHWNENPGTIDNFFIFLHNAYQNRVYIGE